MCGQIVHLLIDFERTLLLNWRSYWIWLKSEELSQWNQEGLLSFDDIFQKRLGFDASYGFGEDDVVVLRK